MSIQYLHQIHALPIREANKKRLLDAKAFRNYCTQYGIPMRTTRDLWNFFKNPNIYLPETLDFLRD